MTVITNAQTTEITGANGKVNGLSYKDRIKRRRAPVELEGVFVQIGLVPNTEWLRAHWELEQVRRNHGGCQGADQSGVFAAGDCTTVPTKQIVIAAGAGATAALSAFDHLIRQLNGPRLQGKRWSLLKGLFGSPFFLWTAARRGHGRRDRQGW